MRPGAGAPLVPADGVHLGLHHGDRPQETDDAIGCVARIHLTYRGRTDEWAISDVLPTAELAAEPWFAAEVP